jgi:hypothetical protein
MLDGVVTAGPPPASALQIRPTGWQPVDDLDRESREDEVGDQLTVNYFPITPDLPPLEGWALREFFRRATEG